ncbi:hypothetical protein GYA49_06310 [Candidatus Beckwithbacteria bacterium]|nr:hypothetical protein [Candidatus Beckwithbacteria bacterium]
MDNQLALDIKTSGGSCVVRFTNAMAFVLNSVEGEVRVDGNVNPWPRGNGLKLTGTEISIDYHADDYSNGFDLWLIRTPALVPTQPAPTKATKPVPSVVTPVPTYMVPAPSTQPATGSCKAGNKEWSLVWDDSKGRLYMDPWIAEAREVNKTQVVTCTLTTQVAGNVEALGKQIPIAAAESWEYTFPKADPSFGFAFQASRG